MSILTDSLQSSTDEQRTTVIDVWPQIFFETYLNGSAQQKSKLAAMPFTPVLVHNVDDILELTPISRQLPGVLLSFNYSTLYAKVMVFKQQFPYAVFRIQTKFNNYICFEIETKVSNISFLLNQFNMDTPLCETIQPSVGFENLVKKFASKNQNIPKFLNINQLLFDLFTQVNNQLSVQTYCLFDSSHDIQFINTIDQKVESKPVQVFAFNFGFQHYQMNFSSKRKTEFRSAISDINRQLCFNSLNKQYVITMRNEYLGFYQIVASNLLKHTQYQQILDGFYDKIDQLVTQLAMVEKLTHTVCGKVQIQFNFTFIREKLLNLRQFYQRDNILPFEFVGATNLHVIPFVMYIHSFIFYNQFLQQYQQGRKQNQQPISEMCTFKQLVWQSQVLMQQIQLDGFDIVLAAYRRGIGAQVSYGKANFDLLPQIIVDFFNDCKSKGINMLQERPNFIPPDQSIYQLVYTFDVLNSSTVQTVLDITFSVGNFYDALRHGSFYVPIGRDMLMLHNFISPNGNADNNLITMEDISKYDSILDYYTSDKYLYEIEQSSGSMSIMINFQSKIVPYLIQTITAAFNFEASMQIFTQFKQFNTSYAKIKSYLTDSTCDLMTTLNQFKNCLVFREIDFIFDFYDLNPIVNQLADYIRYIDCISNYTFTSGMLYFKVGDLISKQKQELVKALDNIKCEVRDMVVQLNQKLYKEIQSIYSQLDFAQVNPFMQEHIQFCKQIFNSQEFVSSLFNNLFNCLHSNVYQYTMLFGIEDLDYFDDKSASYLQFIKLFRLQKKACFFFQGQNDFLKLAVLQCDQWMNKQVFKLYDYVCQVLNLTNLDIDEMVQNPIKFSQKYPLIASNYQVDPLVIDGPRAQVGSFYVGVYRSTTLKILTDDWYKMSYLFEKENIPEWFKLYERQDYKTIQYDTIVQPLSIRSVLSEIRFICQELTAVQQAVEIFRRFLLSIYNADELITQQTMEAPSPFQLTMAITPIYNIVEELEQLQKQYDSLADIKLKDFENNQILLNVERLTATISIMRKNMSVGMEIYGFSHFLKLKYKSCEYFNTTKNKIYKISYDSWINYVIYAEDFVLKFAPSINYLYMLSNKEFSQVQQFLIEQYLQISFQQCTIQDVLTVLENNNLTFDFLNQLWAISKINFLAAQQLMKIYKLYNQIFIESAYPNNVYQRLMPKIDISSLHQLKDIEMNLVPQQYEKQEVESNAIINMLIIPSFVEEICVDSNIVTGFVINNYTFINPKSITTQFDFELNFVHIFQNFDQIYKQLPNEIKQFDAHLLVWKYDRNIEGLARDLEMVGQLIKIMYACIKRIPNLIHDLLLVFYNGKPIRLNDEKDQLSISLLTNTERFNVIKLQSDWTELVSKYQKPGLQTKLLNLVLDTNFTKSVFIILSQLQDIHNRVLNNPFEYLINHYSSPYDSVLMRFINEKKLSSKMSFQDDGKMYVIEKVLVPSINFKYYPLQVLLAKSIQIQFSAYNILYNPITRLTMVQNELFTNLTDVIMDSKIERITAVASHNEHLIFETPLIIPDSLMFVFDYLLYHSSIQMQKEIYKAIDELFLSIEQYRFLRKSSEMEQAIYFEKINRDLQQQLQNVVDFKIHYDSRISIYSNLPSYFKVFENFLNSFVFSAILASLSNYISSIYLSLYDLSVKGKLERNDFKFIYFLLNDLLIVTQTIPDIVSDVTEEAYMCKQTWRQCIKVKLQEWQEIFQFSIKLFQCQDNRTIMNSSLYFPFISYVQVTDKLIVTDSRRTFQLELGNHWLGSASNLDHIYLTQLQLKKLSQIIQNISARQTMFLLGSSEKQYSNEDFQQLVQSLSRMIFRRTITIIVTQFTFSQNLQKVCASLAAGYIVVVIGLEYLPRSQVLYLAEIAKSVTRKRGKLTGLVAAIDTRDQVPSDLGEKSKILIQDVDISMFDDPGFLIFYLPSLKTVQTSIEYKFSKPIIVDEETRKLTTSFAPSKKKQPITNVTEQYQEQFFPDQSIIQIISCFNNFAIINVEQQDVVSLFLEEFPIHGRAFYEISVFLSQFNGLFPKFSSKDIKLIYQKAKDSSDSMTVAILTQDFLLKQMISLIKLDKSISSVPILIASFINGAFGLDKTNSQIINNAAKAFQLYVDSLLIHIGYSQHKQFKPNQKKYTFAEYFKDYIFRYSEQTFANRIITYSNLFSLPLQTIYDIAFCNDILKDQKPCLIVTIHQSYLKIFVTMYASVYNKQIFYVTNRDEMSMSLRTLSVQKGGKLPLFVVVPSSMTEIEQMADQIFGFFQLSPIIQDIYGVPYYQTDISLKLNILFCIDSELFFSFSQNKLASIFQHRFILFPSIEGSNGARKAFIAPFSVDSQFLKNQYYRIPQISDIIKPGIQFDTISPSISLLLKFYQSKMVYSELKDYQLDKLNNRSIVLQQFAHSIISYIFDIITKIFNIGRSYEELLIMRSIFYFFLYKFKIVRPTKKQFNNRFLNIVDKECGELQVNEDQRRKIIDEMVVNDFNSLGFDVFSRKSAFMYKVQQFFAKKAMSDKKPNSSLNQKLSDPYKGVDFGRMIADSLSVGRMNVSDQITTNIDIAGFLFKDFQDIVELIPDLQKVKGSHMKEEINNIHIESIIKDISPMGYGNFGSLEFDFEDSFILDAYIKNQSLLKAFQLVAQPLIVAMWNAASLYFMTITNSGKYSTSVSKGFIEQINLRYEKFISSIQQVPDIECIYSTLLNAPFQLLQQEKIKGKAIQISLLTNSSVLTQSDNPEMKQFLKDVFQCNFLPNQFQELFQYINYHGYYNNNAESKDFQTFQVEISVQTYKLGEGIFTDVSLVEDHTLMKDITKLICSQNVAYRKVKTQQINELKRKLQWENTKDLEKNMYQKLNLNDDARINDKDQQQKMVSKQNNSNPYDSDDEQEVQKINNDSQQQLENAVKQNQQELEDLEQQQQDYNVLLQQLDQKQQLSLQRLSDIMLCFDPHRTALIMTITSCMLSATTFALVGLRGSGKSILVKVAEIIGKELLDIQKFVVGELATTAIGEQFKTTIYQKFQIRNYEIASSCRYYHRSQIAYQNVSDFKQNERFLDHTASQAFPVFYVHASDVQDQQVNSEILNLFKSHMIQIDKVDSQFQRFQGTAILSDCSFLLECLPNSSLIQMCAVSFEVPSITEQFAQQFLQTNFPESEEIQVKQFIQGINLVKQSLPSDLQNNFNIYEQLTRNRNYIFTHSHSPNDRLTEKIQLYETNGLEYDDASLMTPVFQIFKNSNDKELAKLSIHSYFYMLRSLKQVEQIEVENSCEKLASLCLLNKLKTNNIKGKDDSLKIFEETPWSDSSVMLDNNFVIYPAWQAFLINECTQNAKRPASQHAFEHLTNKFSKLVSSLQPLFLTKQNCFFNDICNLNNQDIIISINMVDANQFWFAHFMELFRLYGTSYEPFLLQMVFQVFLIISKRFLRNQAQLQTILQYYKQTANGYKIVGIQADDDLFALKQYIMKTCFRYSAIVTNHFNQIDQVKSIANDIVFNQLLNEDTQDNKKDLDSPPMQNDITSSMGFTLLSCLSVQPTKFVINVTNYDNKRQFQFIQLLADIFQFDIFGQLQVSSLDVQEMQEPLKQKKKKDENKYKQYMLEDLVGMFKPLKKFEKIFEPKQRMIVNINDVVNQVMSFEVNQNETIVALKKMYFNLQKSKRFTSNETYFILIISILRLFVLMSLGLDNSFAFLDDLSEITSNFKQTIGLDCKSKIQSFLPNKTLQSGSNMDQVTYFSRDHTQTNKRFINYSTHEKYLYQKYNCQYSTQTVTLPQQQNPLYQEEFQIECQQYERFKIYFKDFKQLILIINMSLLEQKTQFGITIQSLFTRLLEAQSTLPTIFDFEEMNILCNLMAVRLNISQMIDIKQLVNIISANLSVIVFDDTPINTKKSAQHIALEELGNINTPVLNLISNLAKQYEQISVQFGLDNQNQKQITQVGLLHSLNQTNIKSQSAQEQYIKNKILKSRYNITEIGSRDLLSLFKLSNCQLPKDFVLPSYLGINLNVFKNQFALIVVSVYRQMHTYSKVPICSISSFSSLASLLCDLLMERFQQFFLLANVITTLLKFYTTLSESLRTPVKQMNLQQMNCDYLKNQINSQIENLLNIQKQKNMPIPGEKQSDINKAQIEAQYLRDSLYTIQQVMQNDFNVMVHCAQTAHFSAIAAASFIKFGVSDSVDLKSVRDSILSGQFGNVGNSINDMLHMNDVEISLFNVFYLSILRSLNIPVVHPDYKKRQQFIPEFVENKQYSENDQILLGSSTLLYGQFMFVSDLIEILSFDWPVFLILKALKIQWTPNDENCAAINCILLQYVTGSRQFIVSQNVGLAASAAIASLLLQKNNPQKIYYADVGKAIHLGPDAKEYQQVSQDFLRHVMIADMTNPYISSFVSSIVKAFEGQDKVLLISNFGRTNVPNSNIIIVKFILTMVMNKQTLKNQKIVINDTDIILAQDLHTIPIIITVDQEINIQELAIDLGFYTQYFFDMVSINCPIIPPKRDTNMHEDKIKTINFSKLYIQQQLQSSLFGDRQCSRSTNEMIKVCSLACKSLNTYLLMTLQSYILKFILPITYTPQELVGIKLDAITLSKLQQMISTNELLNRTLLISSFVLNKNPEGQKASLDSVFSMLLRLYMSQINKIALLSDKVQTALVGDHSQIEYTCQYFLQTDVNRLTQEMAFAITYSIDFFRSITIHHFPAVTLQSMDLMNDLFAMLNSVKNEYVDNLKQKYNSFEKKIPQELANLKEDQVKWMMIQYPLIYHVHEEYVNFKTFLVGKILPYLNEKLFYVFPYEYAIAIWLTNSLLFLVLTNIITSQSSQQQTNYSFQIEELEGFVRLQSQSIDDNIRQITSFQLSQVFSQQSNFSLFKLYSELQLKFLKYIDNIQQILPEICSISSQLVYSWLQMNQLARFNNIMKKAMPWFVVNHSSYVSFCLAQNVFLAVIVYFVLQEKEKSNSLNYLQSLTQISKKIEQQLIELPIGLRIPNPACFYVSFILSVALKQEQIVENIDILAKSMRHIFGESPSSLKIVSQPQSELESSSIAVHKYLDQVQFNQLSLSVVQTFIHDSYAILMKLVGINLNDNTVIVPEILYQIYNIIYHSNKTIDIYQQQLKQCQDDGKITAEIMTSIGASPLQINIIYYDTSILAEQMIEFCYSTIEQSMVCNKQLSLATTCSLYQLMETPILIDANPLMNGHMALQSLLHIITEKPTAAPISIIYPVFVLVPSNYVSISLSNFSQCGEFVGQKQQISLFIEMLSKLSSSSNPNVVYLQKSANIELAFKHCLAISMTAIHSQISQQHLSFTTTMNLLSNNIVTIRGLIIFIMKYSLMYGRTNVENKDFIISQIIIQIFNRSISSMTKISTDAPFQAVALADTLFFQQDVPLIFDLIDQRNHINADLCSQYLLYNNYQMIDLYFPPVLSQIVTKNRGIDEKIKNQMNVNIEENDNSDSEAMSMSSSALSMSQRSFSSEISEDTETQDFDDNLSMFSSRSKSSQFSKASQRSAVSTSSHASSQMSQRLGKQKSSLEKNAVEDNFYQNLLTSLQLHAGDMFRPIKTEQIQKQIAEQIFCKQRKLRLYNVKVIPQLQQILQMNYKVMIPKVQTIAGNDQKSDYSKASDSIHTSANQQQQFFIPTHGVINGKLNQINYVDFLNFIDQLKQYSVQLDLESRCDSFSQKDQYRCQQQMMVPSVEKTIRRVMSSPEVINTIQQFKDNHSSGKRYQDFDQMPDLLQCFLRNLQNYDHINFGIYGKQKDMDFVQQGLVDSNLTLENNLLLGTRGFGSFINHWIISANVFAPVLGDIFNFLRMYNSFHSNASLDRQRIIITTEPPKKQPKILTDGSIELAASDQDKGQAPFYIVIRNLELVGLSFDQELKTVVDCTPESIQGYCQSFDLYACAAVIDSWQKGDFDEKLYALNQDMMFLHVCTSHVPVPIKAGGYIHPIVLLPNKTKISSEDYVKRNPFFAVKLI